MRRKVADISNIDLDYYPEMTSVSSWDPARWRHSQHQAYPHHDRPHNSQVAQLSAPTPINPASQSAVLGHFSHEPHVYDGKAQQVGAGAASMVPGPSEPHIDAPTYRDWPQHRHNSAQGGNYDSQQLAKTSPPQTGPLRSSHQDHHRVSMTHMTDVPLTLHIPKTQGSYKTCPA